MSAIRSALRRILTTGPTAEDSVHFHRRSDTTEPCYDRGCTIPSPERLRSAQPEPRPHVAAATERAAA